MSRSLPAILLAVFLSPMSLLAQEPTTQDATSRPSRPFIDRRERMSAWRDRLGTFNPTSVTATQPVTPDEQADVEKFMSTYSPRRWEKFKNVREDRKDKLLTLMRNQIRALQHMKTEDPRIYELRLARLPIEDEMFALAWRLKHEEVDNPVELRKELREKVRQFVDNSLQEQKIRIERMQDHLRRQQQDLTAAQGQLKNFEAQRESVIERGVADIENERNGALKDLAGPMFNPRKGRDGAVPTTEPSADSAESPQ